MALRNIVDGAAEFRVGVPDADILSGELVNIDKNSGEFMDIGDQLQQLLIVKKYIHYLFPRFFFLSFTLAEKPDSDNSFCLKKQKSKNMCFFERYY